VLPLHLCKAFSPILYPSPPSPTSCSVLVATVAAPSVAAAGRPPGSATLADVPPSYLGALSSQGFDVLYVLGVWSTGDAGIRHSRNILADTQADLAVSSPFAVCDLHVQPSLGGDAALTSLTRCARAHGVRVIVDWVPNHVAVDHWWVKERPWMLRQATREEAGRRPELVFSADVPSGLQQGTRGGASASASASTAGPSSVETLYFCHGRDPYHVWRDTVNLNHR
jgi:hypothetical protein